LTILSGLNTVGAAATGFFIEQGQRIATNLSLAHLSPL